MSGVTIGFVTSLLGSAFLLHHPTTDRQGQQPASEAPIADRANDLTAGLGGGPLETLHGECITPAQRAVIMQRIAANRAKLGIQMPQCGIAGTAPLPLFPFYPMGVTAHRDGLDVNYVDLDPTAGILDYLCTSISYNTHRGIDRILRTFDEQVIGVPVFAALDGVVIDTHDGEPDMNTVPLGQPSNYVIIDHGYGIESWYLHLANGSVIPGIGDFVREGEQIGLTASSGNSAWPHLHFETFFLGQTFEPFAGPCRAGPSGWEAQDPFVSSTYLFDFGITSQDLPAAPPMPVRLPVNAQILTSDQNLYFWFQVANMPLQTNWRVVFRRPNGTTEYDSGTQPFGNDFAYRSAWFWFWYPIPSFIPNVATTPGTWHVDFYLGGNLMVQAPFEVVTSVNPNFNRAPEPISLSFDPVSPTPDDTIVCRVNAPLVVADKDYDVVRFRYVWKVNGGTVRDVVSAGHADALQRSIAQTGYTVSVTVTPNDGKVDGTPVMIAHTIGDVCLADLVSSATFQPPPDGVVDAADLAFLLGSWGSCE
jgi:hypothetical protein